MEPCLNGIPMVLRDIENYYRIPKIFRKTETLEFLRKIVDNLVLEIHRCMFTSETLGIILNSADKNRIHCDVEKKSPEKFELKTFHNVYNLFDKIITDNDYNQNNLVNCSQHVLKSFHYQNWNFINHDCFSFNVNGEIITTTKRMYIDKDSKRFPAERSAKIALGCNKVKEELLSSVNKFEFLPKFINRSNREYFFFGKINDCYCNNYPTLEEYGVWQIHNHQTHMMRDKYFTFDF